MYFSDETKCKHWLILLWCQDIDCILKMAVVTVMSLIVLKPQHCRFGWHWYYLFGEVIFSQGGVAC